MFDAFLSCRLLGLPEDNSDIYLEIARHWSGQKDLKPASDGTVIWGDRTRIGSHSYLWYEAPPPADVRVQHAFVSLGLLDGSRVFAFVSPLSGIPMAFQNAAISYTEGHDIPRSSLICNFQLNLTEFIWANWNTISGKVMSLEGVTRDGSYVAASSPRSPNDLNIERFDAIEFYLQDRLVRVDSDFNIRIADVSAEIEGVTTSLQRVFAGFHDHVRLYRHSQLIPS